MVEKGAVVRLDLRGLKCPLNWAHAKLRLERMERGEIIELLVDDPQAARDIPKAAEAEGHLLIANEQVRDGIFRLTIEK